MSNSNGHRERNKDVCAVIEMKPSDTTIQHALDSCLRARVDHVYVVDPERSLQTYVNSQPCVAELNARRIGFSCVADVQALESQLCRYSLVLEIRPDTSLSSVQADRLFQRARSKENRTYDVFEVAPTYDCNGDGMGGALMLLTHSFLSLLHMIPFWGQAARFYVYPRVRVIQHRMGEASLAPWHSEELRAAPAVYAMRGAIVHATPGMQGVTRMLHWCREQPFSPGMWSWLAVYWAVLHFVFYRFTPDLIRKIPLRDLPAEIFSLQSNPKMVWWLLHGIWMLFHYHKYFGGFPWGAASILLSPLTVSFFAAAVPYSKLIWNGGGTDRPELTIPPPIPGFATPDEGNEE